MQKNNPKKPRRTFKTPFRDVNIKPILDKFEPKKTNPDFNPEKQCFLVKFIGDSKVSCLVFAPDRGRAKYEGCKYFKEEMNMLFQKRNDYTKEMKDAHGYRVKQFDKYYKTGKVPILEIMQVLNVPVKCAICGNRTFTYKDYEDGICFAVEEEDLNKFTKGVILCYECMKKYMGL